MKRPIISFFLFSALALLFPASVTVRDCDGNRYRTHPRWPLACKYSHNKTHQDRFAACRGGYITGPSLLPPAG